MFMSKIEVTNSLYMLYDKFLVRSNSKTIRWFWQWILWLMVDFQPVDIICDLILGPNLWDAMHTDDTQLSTMGHRCAWGIPVA